MSRFKFTSHYRFLLLIVACLATTITGCAVRTKAVPQVELQSRPDLPKVPAPSAQAARVPAGYRAEVVLSGLQYPTSVEFDVAGNMYVAEAGYVYGDAFAPARVLRVTPKGEITVAADQLSGPVNDLLWYRDRLYISHRTKISALERNGQVRDLVTGLPSLGDHHNNQLAAGPDGNIYFGQGTATNSGVVGIDNFLMGWLALHPHFHDKPARTIRLQGKNFLTLNPLMLTAKEPGPMASTGGFHAFSKEGEEAQGEVMANGTILRMDPAGKNLDVYAWGLRNPFGVAFDSAGQLFVAENGFDERGSRPIANAPDTLWTIRQGAWYGWPDFASGIPVTDSRFKPEYGGQPEFLMEEHPPVEKPFMMLPEHAGVTKIAFGPGGDFGFRGDLFVAEFGDIAPMSGRVAEPAGHRVMRVDVRTGRKHPFFYAREETLGPPGMEYVTTPGPKRLLEPYFTRNGDALYVTDIGAFTIVTAAAPMATPFPGTGVIWRIVREGTQPSGPPANLTVPPGSR